MKPFAASGLSARLRLLAARLVRDQRGVAAVEFAIVVPIMLVMFFGTVEFSNGVAADRKVSMTAQTLADLTSRYTSVTNTDITNFAAIGDAMMTPYSATPLQATITEIYINPANGVAHAQWSRGDVPRTVGSVVPVPANLIARDASNNIIAGQYLIFTEVSYVYTPAVGYVMHTSVTLTDKSYMRPRLSQCVLLNTTSGSCPTA